MVFRLNQYVFILLSSLIALALCCPKQKNTTTNLSYNNAKFLQFNKSFNSVSVAKSVKLSDYFQYIDSIVKHYDALTSDTLTEHHLVRANPWIIQSLQNTDYYRLMTRDTFVYNQNDLTVLKKGSIISIPDALKIAELENEFQNTRLDINIPEFKLRIIKNSQVAYTCPIRVGRNEKRYLKMSGKTEDLKTKTGEGVIINYVRKPRYVNPINNREYFVTRRDDDKVTKLPQIPFIEAEINGLRHGQLIHPTTNPVTLGKAYSNGCIGTKESDAWLIYYHAPIGTKITIRYDLTHVNKAGDTIVFKDIYNMRKSQRD